MQNSINEVTLNMRMISVLHRIFIHHITADIDLFPGQLPVLEYILAHPGCTQHELANGVLVSPPSVALSTKRMQASGLLKKTTDPDDQRRNRLYVTDRGRELSQHCRNLINVLNEQMLSDFNEDELHELHDMFARMVKNLEQSLHVDLTCMQENGRTCEYAAEGVSKS